MACNKVGYSTKKQAVKEAKIILADIRRYKQSKQKVKIMRQYECKYCGKWHLTSQRFHTKKDRAALNSKYRKG